LTYRCGGTIDGPCRRALLHRRPTHRERQHAAGQCADVGLLVASHPRALSHGILTPPCWIAGPHIVNVSMLLGSALTWGFLWPYISSKEGLWYPASQDETSFSGLFGYKVQACSAPAAPTAVCGRACCERVCPTKRVPQLACFLHAPHAYHPPIPRAASPQQFPPASSLCSSPLYLIPPLVHPTHVIPTNVPRPPQVFITIALLMGDGLYSLAKVMAASFKAFTSAQVCCS